MTATGEPIVSSADILSEESAQGNNSLFSHVDEVEGPWVLTTARIIHIAVFCVMVLYQIVTTGLFLRYREGLAKNKFDSRLILLLTLLGALNMYFCSAENIFGDESLPCWVRHYVSFVQIPTFYFLIVARVWRIVFVTKFQSALLAHRAPSPISSFASYGNPERNLDPTNANTGTIIDLFNPPIHPLPQEPDLEGALQSKKERFPSSGDLEAPLNSALTPRKLVSELRIIGWVAAFYIFAFAIFAVMHFYFYQQWVKRIKIPREIDDYCEKIEDYPVIVSNIIFLLVVPVCIKALRKVDDNRRLGTSLMITFVFSIPLMIMFHLSGALQTLLNLSDEGCIADSFWLLPWYLICHSAFVGIPVFFEFRERCHRKYHPEKNHEDFEDMLSKPSRFREFKQYMTKELCVENALFYEQFSSLLSYVVKRRGNKFKGFEEVTPGEPQASCEIMCILPACMRQFMLASKVPMDSHIESRLDQIYDTFIASNAPNQLNISHSVQATLAKERKEGANNLLSWRPVMKEVYYMMYSNTYFRYVNGSDWKQRLSQTNSQV